MYQVTRGVQTPLPFLLIQSSDHITGATGKVPTAKRTKQPGGAFAASTGVVTELENGWYTFTPTAAEVSTDGPVGVHIEAAGCDPVDFVFQVTNVAADASTTVTRLTAGRAANLDGLTAGRAANLDNLNTNLDTRLDALDAAVAGIDVGGGGGGGSLTAGQAQQLSDAVTYASAAKTAAERVSGLLPNDTTVKLSRLDAPVSAAATPDDVAAQVQALLTAGVALSAAGRAALVNAILRTLVSGPVDGIPFDVGLLFQALAARFLSESDMTGVGNTTTSYESPDGAQAVLTVLEDTEGRRLSIAITPPPAMVSTGATA